MAPGTPLTPVFSAYWDEPEPWTLDTYRQIGGYQIWEKILGGGMRLVEEIVIQPKPRQTRLSVSAVLRYFRQFALEFLKHPDPK